LLIYFLVRLISGKKYRLERWWSVSLIILFIAGVFGLFTIAGSVLRDFRAHYTTTEPLMLQPFNKDTLVLSAFHNAASIHNSLGYWDDKDFVLEGDNIVRFRKSEDTSFHATIEKFARGANKAMATAAANHIHFTFQQNGNHLLLPAALDISQSLPFRNQSVKVTIYVPEGKWVYLKGIEDDWWDEITITYFNKNTRYHRNRIRGYEDYSYYQMNADGDMKLAGQSQQSHQDDDDYYY
jgi:hypothetical protein